MTRVSVWTYRLALLVCPPGFRREFGARMVDDFRALLAECGGAAARFTLALRESADVIRAAWRDASAPRHAAPLGPGKPPLRERLRLLGRAQADAELVSLRELGGVWRAAHRRHVPALD